jgi:hypothetical protein
MITETQRLKVVTLVQKDKLKVKKGKHFVFLVEQAE